MVTIWMNESNINRVTQNIKRNNAVIHVSDELLIIIATEGKTDRRVRLLYLETKTD